MQDPTVLDPLEGWNWSMQKMLLKSDPHWDFGQSLEPQTGNPYQSGKRSALKHGTDIRCNGGRPIGVQTPKHRRTLPYPKSDQTSLPPRRRNTAPSAERLHEREIRKFLDLLPLLAVCKTSRVRGIQIIRRFSKKGHYVSSHTSPQLTISNSALQHLKMCNVKEG